MLLLARHVMSPCLLSRERDGILLALGTAQGRLCRLRAITSVTHPATLSVIVCASLKVFAWSKVACETPKQCCLSAGALMTLRPWNAIIALTETSQPPADLR